MINSQKMKNKKLIAVINTLVRINNDRIEGYETASKETSNKELTNLFFQFIQTSKKCNVELISEVLQMGGKPEEKTKISGKFFRVWMEVKAALTSNNQNSILLSCEYGEKKAIQTYNKVILNNANELNEDQQKIIALQLILINKDHSNLRDLREKILVSA